MIFGDQIARCWKQITRFQQEVAAEQEVGALVGEGKSGRTPDTVYQPISNGSQAVSIPEQEKASTTHAVGNWVHDDRGVRLAREVED